MLPTRCGHCNQIVSGDNPHHCEYCGAPIEHVREYDTRSLYFGRTAYNIWARDDTPAVYFGRDEKYNPDSRVRVEYVDDNYVNNLKSENERLTFNQQSLENELHHLQVEFSIYKDEHTADLSTKIFAVFFLTLSFSSIAYTIVHLLGWI